MGLPSLHALPLTLTAVGIILQAPSDAYSSCSLRSAYSVSGQFGHTYPLNVSCTMAVSVFYKQPHPQVIMYFAVFSSLTCANVGLCLNDRVRCLLLPSWPLTKPMSFCFTVNSRYLVLLC